MNKLTKVAVLPTLALCGAFFGSSAFATGAVDVTPESLDAAVPATVNVDAKEIDAICEIEGTDNFGCISDKVLASITATLTTAGITLDPTTYTASAYWDASDSIYGFDYHVSTTENYNFFNKEITVKYTNTPATPSAEQTAMQNKLGDTLNLYYMHDLDTEYDVAGHTVRVKNAIKKKAEDNSVTASYFSMGGGIDDAHAALGFEWDDMGGYFVFKGDVLYATGAIHNYIGTGFELDDAAPVVVQKLESNSDDYATLKAKIVAKGYGEILGAYELKLAEAHDGVIPATFKADPKYNGKAVIVLHKKADGTIEEFEKTVKNGRVDVEVSELSPFMIALKESSANSTAVKSPNTGVMPKGDNSGANASIIATIVGTILSLSAFVGFRKIAKSKE